MAQGIIWNESDDSWYSIIMLARLYYLWDRMSEHYFIRKTCNMPKKFFIKKLISNRIIYDLPLFVSHS